MKENQSKISEYRIKYNAGAGHSAMDNYHYYSASNAYDALMYHELMMKKRSLHCQIISVERKCPYANKWIDETDESAEYHADI